MTITAEDVRVIHDCNGSVTDFAFTFKIFAEGDIKVIATDSDSVETDLTITTDYTVAGENGAFESGGTVSTVKEVDGVMTSYAYASGYTITILLNLDFKQETDLEYGGTYSSAAIELMSDRLTKIIQQLAAKQKRAFRFKESSSLGELELDDPTAGYYLYSADGISVTWVANVSTGDTEATVFGKSLITDNNASEVQDTLGFTAFIKTLMDDANAYTARKTLKTPLSRVLTTAKTAAYTVASTDDGMLIPVDATAGNIAITLPAVGDLWNGFTIGIKKIDSSGNYVESTPNGAEEIDGAASHILRLENSICWYVVDGTGWKISSNNEIIGAMCVAALKDPTAGTAGLRTLGTTAVKACAGNDSRLSNTRTPTDGSVTVGKLGASAVTQAKLKTSTQSQNQLISPISSHNFVLTGGQYCFQPTVKGENVAIQPGGRANLTTSYATVVSLYNSSGGSNYRGYVIHRYVTSSGEINWLFILRDKNTKKVIGRSIAPDHPCFGNGGNPLLTSHPFGDYDESKYEIIVINPTNEEIEQMELETIVDDETKPDKDLLEVIAENYEIDEDSNPAWPSTPVTVGLPKYIKNKKTGKKVLADYRFMGADTKIQPIKKVIPKPLYIKTKRLKRRK